MELNSSYIQRGMDTSEGVVWFNHLSQLPSWAKEKECEQLKEARWIEKEIFDSITSNVIQMGKEIKLEDLEMISPTPDLKKRPLQEAAPQARKFSRFWPQNPRFYEENQRKTIPNPQNLLGALGAGPAQTGWVIT